MGSDFLIKPLTQSATLQADNVTSETSRRLRPLSPALSGLLDKLFGAFPSVAQQQQISWFKSEIIKSPLLIENLNQAVADKQVIRFSVDPNLRNEAGGAIGFYRGRDIIIDGQSFNSAYNGKNSLRVLTLIDTLGHECFHAITREKLNQYNWAFQKLRHSGKTTQDLTEPTATYLNQKINSEARAAMEGYNCVNDYLLTQYPSLTLRERFDLLKDNSENQPMTTIPAVVDQYNEIQHFDPSLVDAKGFAIPERAQALYIKEYAEKLHYPETILTDAFNKFRPGTHVDLAKLGITESRIKEHRWYTYPNAPTLVDISDSNRPCKVDFGQQELNCSISDAILKKASQYSVAQPSELATATPRTHSDNSNDAFMSTGTSQAQIINEVLQVSKDPSLHQSLGR